MNTIKNKYQIVDHLRQGDVVGLPTETVYGLAADITQSIAVQKIFLTKERPFFDPLIVHIADLAQLAGVVDLSRLAATASAGQLPPLVKTLADKFWPGPLTMVLPKHAELNTMITSGLETVGVRMPRHPLALEVIIKLGHPVAAPSANKFGRTSPTTAEHVHSEFAGRVPVLDGGACEIGVESTVIGFNETFSEIFIYRPGAVTLEMLSAFAPTSKKQAQLSVAPGQLQHHYMPDKPLVWFKTTQHLSIDIYENLCRQLNVRSLQPSWMTLSEKPSVAARELYASLRNAAAKPHSNCILLRASNLLFESFHLEISSKNHEGDLYAAITDRLEKAATLIL